MPSPRAYVKADSISLKHGSTLSICASFETTSGAAQWRILRVTSMTPYYVPSGVQMDPSAPVYGPGIVNVTLSNTGVGPWNREEVGYGWPVAGTFTIPNDPVNWPVGLYVVQVRNGTTTPAWTDASVANAFFIVRPTSPTTGTKILFCYPWSTTVAYAGGVEGAFLNLYNSPQPGRSRAVALERPWDSFPYDDSPYSGAKKPYHTLYLPFVLAQYFESQGYAVDYCTSFDLHNESGILSGYQLFVSAGHDEYWSSDMRDHVEQFVSAGGNAAFFSANTSWWQVRFANSGTQMVCFKTAIEDPNTTTSSSSVTTNWCSTPPGRPENTLTGVSYRRGSAAPPATATYTTATFPNAFLTGAVAAVGDPIGDTTNRIFYTETDALNYSVSGGVYSSTGYDGSPLNFTILAYANLMTATGQPGYATMGYFTNNGTVFTAATTDWPAGLGNSAVAKITQNVLSLLTVPQTGASASYLTRAVPTTSWAVLDSSTVSNGIAIAGVNNAGAGSSSTGQLVIARSGGTLEWRDPEAYSQTSWQSYSAPSLSNIKAMASDILGRNIIAVRSTASSPQQRTPDSSSSSAWTAFSGSGLLTPASTTGIGATIDLFVFNLSSGNFGELYRHSGLASSTAWVQLGRTPYQPRSMTAFDAKLFMTTGDGKLLMRDAAPVDLVWAEIGTASTGIFSLAAYYGRLFALDSSTGTTRLLWRTATPTSAFYEPSQLFYKASTGDLTIGSLAQCGAFTSTASTIAGSGYSHVVRANNGIIFLYKQSNGAAVVLRYTASGTPTTLHTYTPGSFGAWTHVVYVPPSLSRSGSTGEHIFFYDSTTGQGVTGHFNTTTGVFVTEKSYSTFSTGWSQVVCTAFGELFFYNSSTGAWATGSLDNAGNFYTDASGSGVATGFTSSVAVGQTCVLLFKSSNGSGAVYDCFSSATLRFSIGAGGLPSSSKLASSSNGAMLCITSTGTAVAGGVDTTSFVHLRDYNVTGTFSQYDIITDVGVLPP